MKALSRESRLLIDAAREGDEPSAADRKRVRRALGKKLAIGVAAGAVAATATHAAAGGVTAAGTSGAAASAVGIGAGAASVGGGVLAVGSVGAGSVGAGSVAAGAIAASFGTKLLVSAVLLGVMGAGTVGYVRHEEAKRADARALVQAQAQGRSAAATPLGNGGAAQISPLGPAHVAAPVTAPPPPAFALPGSLPNAAGGAAAKTSGPSAAPPAASPSSPSPSPAPSELDAELALLQDVHGALRTNDGPRALRLLDEHARRFPNGALAEESEAARVFALCQVGRADEARDVAGRFLREHARSPLAPRVARACDEEGSTF